METIKAFTTIEQSRKLSEILPFESADMSYSIIHNIGQEPYHCNIPTFTHATHDDIPCWSLAALLGVLPDFIGDYGKCLYHDVGGYYCGYMVDGDFMLTIEETNADNQIDACYEMILKLHEQKLL